MIDIELLKQLRPDMFPKDVTILTKKARIVYKDGIILEQTEDGGNTITYVPKGVEFKEFDALEEKTTFIKSLDLKTVEQIVEERRIADALLKEAEEEIVSK